MVTSRAETGGSLPISQGPGLPPEDRILGMTFLLLGVLVLVPRTIVTGVDHKSVLTQSQLIEGIEKAAGFEIEFLDHIAV